MIKFIKLEDGTEIVFEATQPSSGQATIFVDLSEEPGAYASVCNLTKKDAKHFRDVLDEWLREEDEE